MRKIGIVTEYFYPHLGGITEHVYFFSKELLKRGLEVVILTGYEGEELRTELPPGLRIVNLGKSVSIYSNHSFGKVTLGWNLGKKVREILKREQFDLIHIHSPTIPVLPYLFQRYAETVTVGTIHTYLDGAESRLYYHLFRWLEQRCLNGLNGVIAVSPSCVESMKNIVSTNCTIIPNGVDVQWFRNSAKKIPAHSHGTSNILFLARLNPRNGLNILINAMPHVLKNIPKARLIIVGDGPMRSFYEKAAGSLLNRTVFFEGQVNDARPAYFATSDVFCYPATKASSFGITLLEAMSAGKPVVAADNPGFRTVIKQEVNGLLVPPSDPKELAQGLIRVLTDKALARKLVENGLKTADEYSWSSVTDRVLRFYEDVYLRTKGVPFLNEGSARKSPAAC